MLRIIIILVFLVVKKALEEGGSFKYLRNTLNRGLGTEADVKAKIGKARIELR